MNNAPVDWERIDTVLLDMDGTLLDLHFDNHFWQGHVPVRYAERHGLAEDEARDRLAPRFEETRGTLDWYCLDFWTRELDLDIVALKHEVADRIAILPGVVEFLGRVRDSGRALWLVTNAHRDSVGIKVARTGIDAHFDRVISAHDFGHPKESPAFWDALQAQHEFDPDRALFVDDSLSVLASAQRWGIGQVIAVRCPDTKMPPRTIDGFPSVDAIADLWQERTS